MKNTEILKILICGSREFENEILVKKHISIFLAFIKSKVNIENVIIISGRAKGPDTFGEIFAKENNLEVELYPADWDKHGKAAGFIRNKQMVDVADFVLAFHYNKSKGTQHSINMAIEKKIPVIVWDENWETSNFNTKGFFDKA